MSKASDSPLKANWQTIDPASLPAPIAKQYERCKEAYKEMKADREAFEQAMRAQATIPQGKRLVFGYNFGKLSVALVDDTAKPASTKGMVDLGTFLGIAISKRT